MLLKRIFAVLLMIMAGRVIAQEAAPVPTVLPQSDTLFQMGMNAYNRQDVGKAREIFALAVTADPNNWMAMYMRAALFDCSRESDAENAIELFNRALVVNPDAAMVYVSTGICYAKSGQMVRALANFGEALRRIPGAAEPIRRVILIHVTGL